MGWQCRARDGSGLVRGLIVDKGHSQAFTFATESAQRTPDDIPLVPCWNQHGHVGKIRPIPLVTRFESLARTPRSPWYENQGHPQQGAHSNQQFHYRAAKQSTFLWLGVFRFAVLRIEISAKDKNGAQGHHEESNAKP